MGVSDRARAAHLPVTARQVNSVREVSGRGLAVCDHIDWCLASCITSPLVFLGAITIHPGVHRGFLRFVVNTADTFSNLILSATGK